MLKLFKRPGSPFWYVRGRVHGQSVYASTKETDKASARRFKDAFEIRLARADQKCHAVTFREAADLYLEARPHLTTQWVTDIERLCGAIGDRFLADVHQATLVDVANVLYSHCLAASKNRHVFGPAGAVLHYAAENDLCQHARVKKLKEKQPVPRAMRKEDAAKLIAAAEGKMKLLLVWLFSQGWRISDTLRLMGQDIDMRRGTVRHYISKTDQWRTTPLNLAVLNMLRDDPVHVGRVFPWRNRQALHPELRRLCHKVGVAFTPHCARHSFATWLNADGASVKEIMEAGGWRDYRSVLRYTSVDEKRVRATVNRIKI